MKHGVYWKTKKRQVGMYLYGSTITATQYPKFIHKGKEYVLPRPYGNCKPNNSGQNLFSNNPSIYVMINDIEKIVINFLQYHCKNLKLARQTLLDIQASKDIIPKSLRLADNCFTHSTVISTFDEVNAQIPPHFDENDVISVIFHAGRVKEGGETLYYNGFEKREIGDEVFAVPFRHGRIQIGFYQNVLHSVRKWRGTRCIINFNLKKRVIQHFREHGSKYYDSYLNMGCPNGTFVAF